MRAGLTKQEKSTNIWFGEKEPTIHIRIHNTDLKNRMTRYSRQNPGVCKLMDDAPKLAARNLKLKKVAFHFG